MISRIAVTLVISERFGTSTNVDLLAAAITATRCARTSSRARRPASPSSDPVQQRIDNVQQLRDAGIRITDFADSGAARVLRQPRGGPGRDSA